MTTARRRQQARASSSRPNPRVAGLPPGASTFRRPVARGVARAASTSRVIRRRGGAAMKPRQLRHPSQPTRVPPVAASTVAVRPASSTPRVAMPSFAAPPSTPQLPRRAVAPPLVELSDVETTSKRRVLAATWQSWVLTGVGLAAAVVLPGSLIVLTGLHGASPHPAPPSTPAPTATAPAATEGAGPIAPQVLSVATAPSGVLPTPCTTCAGAPGSFPVGAAMVVAGASGTSASTRPVVTVAAGGVTATRAASVSDRPSPSAPVRPPSSSASTSPSPSASSSTTPAPTTDPPTTDPPTTTPTPTDTSTPPPPVP